MTLLYMLLLAGLALATRVPFLLARSSDRDTHLWFAHAFDRLRRGDPTLPGSIIDGYIGYQPQPAALLARVPAERRPTYATALNLGADVLHVVVVFLLVRHAAFPFPGGEHASFAFACLFATLPVYHPVNARLVSLGGRTLGPLLVTSFVLAAAAMQAGGLATAGGLLLGAGTTAGILVTSQFAVQAMVLVVPAVSASLWSPLPAAAALIGLAFCLLHPAVRLGRLMRARRHHILWYLTAKNLHIDERNDLRRFAAAFASRDPRRLLGLAVYSLTAFTPTIAAVGLGGAAAALLAAPEPAAVLGTSLGVACAAAACAAAAACVLTAVGPLRVFGEAERYLEYAAPFLVLAAAMGHAGDAAAAAHPVVLAAVAWNVAASILQWSVFMAEPLGRVLSAAPPTDTAPVAAFLDARPRRRVATGPISLASRLALATSGGHSFLHVLVVGRDGRFTHWEEDLIGYPHIRASWRHFDRKYGVDTLVFERQSLERSLRLDPDRDLGSLRPAYEDALYVVYEAPPAGSAASGDAAGRPAAAATDALP